MSCAYQILLQSLFDAFDSQVGIKHIVEKIIKNANIKNIWQFKRRQRSLHYEKQTEERFI